MVTISENLKESLPLAKNHWRHSNLTKFEMVNYLRSLGSMQTNIHCTIKEVRCHEVNETSRNSYVWRREGWHRWPWVTEWRSRMGKGGSDKTWTCWEYRTRYALYFWAFFPDLAKQSQLALPGCCLTSTYNEFLSFTNLKGGSQPPVSDNDCTNVELAKII